MSEKSLMPEAHKEKLIQAAKQMTNGKDYEVVVMYIKHIEDGRLITEQIEAVEFTSLITGKRVFIGEAFID